MTTYLECLARYLASQRSRKGMGGDKSVIDAGNKVGIHGLKSSLDSAIDDLVGGGGGDKLSSE